MNTAAKSTLGEGHRRHAGRCVFADYTCRTLCGPIVEFAAAGLAKTGLRPGVDYRLLVIGLDPRDGIDAGARDARKAHRSANAVGPAAVFLSWRRTRIRRRPSGRLALRL